MAFLKAMMQPAPRLVARDVVAKPVDKKKKPAFAGFWLPNSSSSKYFSSCLVIDIARARADRKGRKLRHNILARALEGHRQLEAGEVESRAAIARREGLSRARVTQVADDEFEDPNVREGCAAGAMNASVG